MSDEDNICEVCGENAESVWSSSDTTTFPLWASTRNGYTLWCCAGDCYDMAKEMNWSEELRKLI